MGIFDIIKNYFLERKREREEVRHYYNDYIRFNHLEKTKTDKDGKYVIKCSSFDVYEFPEDMTCEDGVKVISFVRDKVAKDLGLDEYDLTTASTTSKLLEKFHFKKQREYDESDIVDLVTCKEKIDYPIKGAIWMDDCFWYVKGVTEEEIKNIYKNRNEEIDLKPLTKEDVSKSVILSQVYIKQDPHTM